jgi:hypothetical protein
MDLSENWPKYLNENILKTIQDEFCFEKMTPVQVNPQNFHIKMCEILKRLYNSKECCYTNFYTKA